MAETAQGPDLETIATEALGFLSIAGEAKVRITSTWGDALPSKHACLLTIASRRGLVAAAGPDAVILANTQTIRKTFEANPEDGSDIRNLQPELRLPMPMRVSLLAFTADENLLIMSAESGGGLAIYDVAALLQGGTQSTFELGTNGESLRALSPNPTKEKAELCAVLTEGGNLHMANLRERALGPLLRSQVSSIAWSTRGKQLVAGLADGTIAQITPEGEVKAVVPKPPCIEGDFHVSSITWLENNLFLVIHTSTNLDPAESVYNIINRTTPSSFAYQKLSDPVDPYGSNKPLHHSIARIKDYAPNITDLLLVTSTASSDLGMFTRAKQPLDPEKPADAITNVFTMTEMVDDTRRATIPMTESMDDSISIGSALDLSSKDTVYKPIPGHELEESPGPLPGFWLLTHEGVLCVWWIVYTDAVKQGVTYQGMAVVEEAGGANPQPAAHAPALAFASRPSAQAFGAPSGPAPAFGGASALGSRASPWGAAGAAGSAPTFGSSTFGSAPAAPTFGQPSQPTFGQPFGMGAKASPWGAAVGGSTFGQSGFASLGGGDKPQGVFGGGSGGGGFASFANKGGFAAIGGDKPSGSAFGSGGSLSMDTDTSFPPPKPGAQGGNGFAEFKLESSFKRDPAADKDEPTNGGGGGSLFGSAFGSALGGAAAEPAIKEEEMGGSAPEPEPVPKPQASLFGTPAGKPFGSDQSKFGPSTVSGGIFGSVSSTPAAPPPTDGGSLFAPKPSTGIFGQPSTSAFSGSFGQPTSSSLFGAKPAEPAKSEEKPKSDAGNGLPPDFLPKPAAKPAAAAPKAPTPEPEAPMPPDFVNNTFKKSVDVAPKAKQSPPKAPAPPAEAALPDDEDGFSEGSGVDVAQELAQSTVTSAPAQKIVEPKPQSAFGSLNLQRTTNNASPLFGGEPSRSKAPTPSQSLFQGPGLGQSHRSSASDSLRPGSVPPAGSQLGRRSPLPQQPAQPSLLSQSQSRLGSSILGGSRPPSVDPFAQSHRQSLANREAEERQLLADQDDGAQALLASELQPTLVIDEFVAHTDVVTAVNETISSQVEAVYRDINAMLDTLGINARSLECFTKGHNELKAPGDRTMEDIDTPDKWTLGELPNLADMIRHDLVNDLNEGRVKDLDGKFDTCKNLTRDLGRLRARKAELERIVAARMDPQQAGTTRSFPLTPEQSAQQNDLRREYSQFTKNLAEAEEALTLLKARIASINSVNTKSGVPRTPGGTAMPTVDAVIRTIAKMTSIAEKRSGDIDVLENQMRKIRLNLAAARSREGTPNTMTPQKRASIAVFSPDGSVHGTTPRSNLRSSLGVAPVSPVSAHKVAAIGPSPEEKAKLLQRLARRRDVLRRLEAHVHKEGVKTWVVEEPVLK